MSARNTKASTSKPIIGITMGDAAGIGPEVVVKALSVNQLLTICTPVIIGDLRILERAVKTTGKTLRFQKVSDISDIRKFYNTKTILVLDLHNINFRKFKPGTISADCGRAAMEYIETASRLALSGKINALVTAPISKEATVSAGYKDIGHLEYLASLSGTKQYATMLVSGTLRTVHLTTHYSLVDACALVKKKKIIDRIKLANDSFKKWGVTRPRIGVAALNPHGGEGGILGREEIVEIIPAVNEARAIDIDARGPYPADSIFNRALKGEFDVVLAMYHDQGHIPVKVHGFEKSVSIALGLPYIRTSVDHGTAFDIAWQGKAEATSMQEAIITAVSLYKGKLLTRG